MNCPVCNVPLTMASRQGIEIDYCPQCRGVWLDRGELDKILDRTMEELGRQSAPLQQAPSQPHSQEYAKQEHHGHHHDDDHDKHNYQKHRKRSMWHQVFEILD